VVDHASKGCSLLWLNKSELVLGNFVEQTDDVLCALSSLVYANVSFSPVGSIISSLLKK